MHIYIEKRLTFVLSEFFCLKSFNSFFVEKKNKHKIHATVTHNTHKNSFVASILGHHML
jgi:hypothetical protein